MSTTQRTLNWIGVVLTLTCLAIVLAGNTAAAWRWEHAAVPLSWVLGAGAIIAFLATEWCDTQAPLPGEAEDPAPALASQWETVES